MKSARNVKVVPLPSQEVILERNELNGTQGGDVAGITLSRTNVYNDLTSPVGEGCGLCVESTHH